MSGNSFYDQVVHWEQAGLTERIAAARENDVLRALEKDSCDEHDFLALVSPAAAPHLEAMARKSRALTLAQFGKVIFLYAPLYLANICDNECVYCGFRHSNRISRKKLSPEEAVREARVIAASGIRHVLVLTGESRVATPVSYIAECISRIKPFFTSISIEIYSLTTAEYVELAAAGADGMTMYQETYNEALYRSLHLKGPKTDYRGRLESPERACRAGMRSIGVGALQGLDDFRRDGFFTGLHAAWLQDTFPDVEIGVSLPRIQPQVGGYTSRCAVTDRDFVQLLTALRIFLPRASMTVSTRERVEFRRNLIGLGVTRLSAGSRTEVGGYSQADNSEGQFSIADTSTVDDVKAMVEGSGYQPVFKDWQML